MNEQKLKLLIKFEKIKTIEDFYNVIYNYLTIILYRNSIRMSQYA
jgi:hypothetical protein